MALRDTRSNENLSRGIVAGADALLPNRDREEAVSRPPRDIIFEGAVNGPTRDITFNKAAFRTIQQLPKVPSNACRYNN